LRALQLPTISTSIAAIRLSESNSPLGLTALAPFATFKIGLMNAR
jgi:hypothetical protein